MGRQKKNSEVPPPERFPISGLNREHLAAAFGVSVRTIANYITQGMPRHEAGFSLPECISWFAAQGGPAKAKKDQPAESPDKSPWLEAYRKERARMARMDRLRMSGSLISKDEAVRQFADRAFDFGRALLSLGRRFSAKVAAKCKKTIREVEAIHEREARKVLEDYSRPIEIKEEKA